MSILITICARGGSKGIPGKNIRPIGGRRLIDYSITIANAFAEKHGGKVALSTDSEEIRAAAGASGLHSSYRRPEALASDTAGKIDTIRDLLEFEEKQQGAPFDFVLDLDVTSPLRTMDDLESAFRMLKEDENALDIFSVNPAGRNPYFNMVEQKENGYFSMVKQLSHAAMTRQSAPKVYDLNASFYIYRREFFDMMLKSPITERSLVFEMSHLCFDLDHPIDFEFMEYLMEHKKLDFALI